MKIGLWLTSIVVLLLAFSHPAFADTVTLDPVGFCPPPATASACTTGTGFGLETIPVGTTSVGMFKNGNGGTAVSPWDLLIAVPNDVGGAPVITFNGGAFTQVGSVDDEGQFTQTTAGSIYDFADGVIGDSSMNASNLFGPNTVAAFGSVPTFFEIFAYSFSPAIADNTAYELTASGAGFSTGTYLAAAGGSHPFSTPYTTTGLVFGPSGPPPPPPSVPEPTSLLLVGTGLLGLARFARKRPAKA